MTVAGTTMTLFWSSRSPYVRKVMVAAHECGLADQLNLVRVDVATVRPTAMVTARNPLGKIPTLLLHDDTALYDSSVICEYFHSLNDEAGLLPHDFAQRITALRRQALGNGLMDVLVMGRAEAKRPDGSRSMVHVAAYDRKLGDILSALEAESVEMAGDAFSIGHIAIGCALSYLDFRYGERDWRQDAPNLALWHAGFLQRPSVMVTSYAEQY